MSKNISILITESPNTWGTQWNVVGNANTIFGEYSPTEIYIPYYDTVPPPAPHNFVFTQDMQYGQTSNDITELQKRLGVVPQNGHYGPITKAAVFEYQQKNLTLTWFEKNILQGNVCGKRTRAALNGS